MYELCEDLRNLGINENVNSMRYKVSEVC